MNELKHNLKIKMKLILQSTCSKSLHCTFKKYINNIGKHI